MSSWEDRVSNHWLALVNGLVALLSLVPWLAPAFMRVGALWPARVIYFSYSFLCHQLATRSFFLFGAQPTYALAELHAAFPEANTWSRIGDIVGNAALGYKVAWSDRMVSLFAGILFGGLLFGLLRRSLKPLRWRLLALLTLPIALDGATHMVSDIAGFAQGFRHANTWLAALTANALPASFYVGDGLGSLNSSLRLASGLIFGLALTWALYPRFERSSAAPQAKGIYASTFLQAAPQLEAPSSSGVVHNPGAAPSAPWSDGT